MADALGYIQAATNIAEDIVGWVRQSAADDRANWLRYYVHHRVNEHARGMMMRFDAAANLRRMGMLPVGDAKYSAAYIEDVALLKGLYPITDGYDSPIPQLDTLRAPTSGMPDRFDDGTGINLTNGRIELPPAINQSAASLVPGATPEVGAAGGAGLGLVCGGPIGALVGASIGFAGGMYRRNTSTRYTCREWCELTREGQETYHKHMDGQVGADADMDARLKGMPSRNWSAVVPMINHWHGNYHDGYGIWFPDHPGSRERPWREFWWWTTGTEAENLDNSIYIPTGGNPGEFNW